jgi:hypothetical protein
MDRAFDMLLFLSSLVGLGSTVMRRQCRVRYIFISRKMRRFGSIEAQKKQMLMERRRFLWSCSIDRNSIVSQKLNSLTYYIYIDEFLSLKYVLSWATMRHSC